MHREKAGTKRERRGGAALELALLVPPLCLACLATVDFGRGFSTSMDVAACARSGAVQASFTRAGEPIDVMKVQATAEGAAPALTPPPAIVVETGEDAGGPFVEVRASYTFRPLFHYPGGPADTTLIRTVRMRRTPS